MEHTIVIISSFGLVFLFFLQLLVAWLLSQIHAAIDAVNRKLELLMRHSGLNLQDVAQREVEAMLRENPAFNKIAAIKRYRELTGARLAEAKAAVERIQQEARTV